MKKNDENVTGSQSGKEDLPGDPVYAAEEDIYNKEKKESLPEEESSSLSEGLDVPGSELDDADEMIGEEDEENNYYSIGGDDHNNLDEDK
jgi:hypothetical protein